MIEFGEWRGSLSPLTSGSVIDNVIPVADGYAPMPGLAAAPGAGALPAAPLGAISIVKRDGGFEAYIGTSANIYKLSGTFTFSSIGSGYTITSGYDWGRVHFGNFLLFSNSTDGMLQYNVESPGSVTAVSGAPAAVSMFVANNQLFALGDTTSDLKIIKYSDLNDHTNWTTGMSGYQVLEDGQDLIAGAALNDRLAVVFQRNAIRILNFVNTGGLGFTMATIKGRGSVNARSMVPQGGWAYYLDVDGFWRTSGGLPEPIGGELVNRWFIDNIDPTEMENVQGAYSPDNTMIWWAFTSKSGSSGTFDRMIGFNTVLKRWVTATVDTKAVFSMATPGYTLEELDAFGTLETLTYSLDSRAWQGGQPSFAGLDSSLKFGFFNAGNLAATLDLPNLQLDRSTVFLEAIPLTDASNATFSVGTAQKEADSITYATPVSTEADGRAMIRARGKVVTGRVAIAADEIWTYANGVDGIVSRNGARR
jgi:hypothetical protein